MRGLRPKGPLSGVLHTPPKKKKSSLAIIDCHSMITHSTPPYDAAWPVVFPYPYRLTGDDVHFCTCM